MSTGTAAPRPDRPPPCASTGCPAPPRTSRSGCRTTRRPSWSPCAPTHPSNRCRPRSPGVAAPRQFDQPRLQRRQPVDHVARGRRPTLGGVELINLGLGGSALLDPFTARTMRDTPADLISVKIGINLVNADLMRLRAFIPAVHGFLDTIREGHPTTPLLVVSRSCARSTRTRRARRLRPGATRRRPGEVHRHRKPGRSARRQADAEGDPRRAGPHLAQRSPPTIRTCTTWTASTCTAKRTPPSCRCPTASTRTPPPTTASPNGSSSTRSPRARSGPEPDLAAPGAPGAAGGPAEPGVRSRPGLGTGSTCQLPPHRTATTSSSTAASGEPPTPRSQPTPGTSSSTP